MTDEDSKINAFIGEPDTLPVTFCRRCKVDVEPVGKGKCPRCGGFLRQHFVSRKHPVNVLRRDQLHAENIAEYQPDTLHLRWACRWLANVTERLESVRDGTPEHQRLVEMWRSLTTTLEEARTSTRSPRSTLDAYATLSNAQLAALLRAHADEAARAAAQEADGQRLIAEAAREQQPTIAPQESSPVLPPAASLDVQCAYCDQLASACVEIHDEPRWLGEHATRSDVIEHRERQRRVRIAWGHETEDGRGVLHTDDVIRPGGTTKPDNAFDVMLHQIRRRR
jgi:hypothetical protein